jgi:hypothetical protein
LLERKFHPKTYYSISDDDLNKARNSGCWFFRKIDPGCDCGKTLDLNPDYLAGPRFEA